MSKKFAVYTIGHSTHSTAQFVGLLFSYRIQEVVDVRTIPGSRHNPQFNSMDLAGALRAAHIGYVHFKDLGGLRHAKKDSINLGWTNLSFRGYADYMRTRGFETALSRLSRRVEKKCIVVMCAETLPWKCHRSLIADALTVLGYQVYHILTCKEAPIHRLTSFLSVQGNTITYPDHQGQTGER